MVVASDADMMTLDEAARAFNVSVSTLRFWRDRGDISKLKRGRIVVVDAAEVRREVEKRRTVRREE